MKPILKNDTTILTLLAPIEFCLFFLHAYGEPEGELDRLLVLRGEDGPDRGRVLLLWMDIGCLTFIGLLATEIQDKYSKINP